LDALSDSFEHQQQCDARRVIRKYFRSKNTAEAQAQAQALCCKQVAEAYQDFKEEGVPHALMTKIDRDVVENYSRTAKKFQTVYRQAAAVKKQMHENILQGVANIEKAEDLVDLSNDLLEGAKVFKKRAKKLHNHYWRAKMVGVGVAAVVGGGVGLMAGGPAGAVVLTEMASIAGAQAIETLVGAAIFGGLYLGADKVGSWAFSQTLRFML
jgi:uncharacterized protein (DUF4415 family)